MDVADVRGRSDTSSSPRRQPGARRFDDPANMAHKNGRRGPIVAPHTTETASAASATSSVILCDAHYYAQTLRNRMIGIGSGPTDSSRPSAASEGVLNTRPVYRLGRAGVRTRVPQLVRTPGGVVGCRRYPPGERRARRERDQLGHPARRRLLCVAIAQPVNRHPVVGVTMAR
jgi:hypothetical protein